VILSGWPGDLPLAAVAALLVAWLTVSYALLKAAVTNPAKSLKAE